MPCHRRELLLLSSLLLLEGAGTIRPEPASNAVDVCIKRLRQKIDRRGQPSLILTRRGEGYMLATPSAT